MGRLQKKKSSGSKKKKRTASIDQDSGSKGNVAEKRPALFSGGSADASKPSASVYRQTYSAPISPASGNGFIGKALQFLREVKIELKKVTWPSRKQTIGSTVVVLILVVIISFFLGAVDFVLNQFVRMILQ